MEHVRYVSIGGAGTKGIMYAGGVDAIEQQLGPDKFNDWHDNLLGAAGTSAGSIAALILLLGTDTRVREKYIRMLCDMHSLVPSIDVGLLVSSYGCDNGDELISYVQNLLKDSGLSPESTLRDVRRLLRKEFVCIATDLTAKKMVRFDSERTPNVRVCDAIYMSCCVPLIFKPQTHNGHVMVDGSLLCGTPLVFPPEQTMFWSVKQTNEDVPIRSLAEFLQNVILCSMHGSTQVNGLKNILFEDYSHDRPMFDMELDTSGVQSLYNIGFAGVMTQIFGVELIRHVGDAVSAVALVMKTAADRGVAGESSAELGDDQCTE
jgi:hypothetical protein